MTASNDNDAHDVPNLTIDDIVYFMGWHMDSQRRIYDVLLSLLAAQGLNDKAKQLQTMHAEGKFLYPPFGAPVDGDTDETE